MRRAPPSPALLLLVLTVSLSLSLPVQTPRPIGFISTVNAKGETNLAPFSYFAAVGHDPLVVMVSFTHPNGDDMKGTCENILTTKEFSANMCVSRMRLSPCVSRASSSPALTDSPPRAASRSRSSRRPTTRRSTRPRARASGP